MKFNDYVEDDDEEEENYGLFFYYLEFLLVGIFSFITLVASLFTVYIYNLKFWIILIGIFTHLSFLFNFN